MKPTQLPIDATFDQIRATNFPDYMDGTTLGKRPSLDGPHQPAMMPTQAIDASNETRPAKSDDPDWNTTDNFPPSKLEADDAK